MAETTNPVPGVAQEPQDVQSRMANFLTQYDAESADPGLPDIPKPQAKPEPTAPQADEEVAEQPEGQATDEVTLDDLPADPVEAQPAVDAFEIVHNGAQVKLNREEVIKHAQQGFDYTRKAQALAETQKQVEASLQKVQEIEQMQVALGGDMAQVKALEAQLKPWMGVDWVQVATNEPLEYPKYRAQYDVLAQSYQRALGEFNHKAEQIKQQRGQITAQFVQQERAKLAELIPAWKDPAKAEAGVREVRDFLLREGISEEQINGLNDSKAVVIAYKAAQYDKLLKAKTEKVKQLKPLPPMTRPGESVANTGNDAKLRERLVKTGSKEAAAALLANRWK